VGLGGYIPDVCTTREFKKVIDFDEFSCMDCDLEGGPDKFKLEIIDIDEKDLLIAAIGGYYIGKIKENGKLDMWDILPENPDEYDIEEGLICSDLDIGKDGYLGVRHGDSKITYGLGYIVPKKK
jgi:hypothetical protein